MPPGPKQGAGYADSFVKLAASLWVIGPGSPSPIDFPSIRTTAKHFHRRPCQKDFVSPIEICLRDKPFLNRKPLSLVASQARRLS